MAFDPEDQMPSQQKACQIKFDHSNFITRQLSAVMKCCDQILITTKSSSHNDLLTFSQVFVGFFVFYFLIFIADMSTVDAGDTAWMLISSALVLFMTPG